jgi:thiol-disulfide isomerase/thioredoxin
MNNYNKKDISPSKMSGSMLSRIKNSVSNPKTIMYITISILFISLSIFLYYKYVAPKLKPNYNSNMEPTRGENNDKSAELLLFHTDWCPHCKTAKPIWEDLKSSYANKTINGYQVIFTDINCTEESPEVQQLMDKYKIEGYPTIKLLKDGQVIEYDAKPSKETLIQFLNTVL